MRLGIDLDGVVFDSEKDLRICCELYDMLELKRDSKIAEREIRFEDRFSWTKEEAMEFLKKYHPEIVENSNYMPGAKKILKMLKDEGHELVVVTARGGMDKKIIELTEKRLKNDNMNIFDKYCYASLDKVKTCKEENIDIMIDDSNENCKNTSENRIKTIYF